MCVSCCLNPIHEPGSHLKTLYRGMGRYAWQHAFGRSHWRKLGKPLSPEEHAMMREQGLWNSHRPSNPLQSPPSPLPCLPGQRQGGGTRSLRPARLSAGRIPAARFTRTPTSTPADSASLGPSVRARERGLCRGLMLVRASPDDEHLYAAVARNKSVQSD